MELELKGITKRFGSLVANDHIDLAAAPGQVHALLGENGAGKTTLMNVLYGLLQPDEGQILIDAKPVQFHSPKDAIAAGIGMVHQHFMLVPVFTVAENVTLGIEETNRAGLLDRRKTRRAVRELSRRYGLDIDPDAIVENLPVGIQQRVEIVKALVREASVLILDEPTAVLSAAKGSFSGGTYVGTLANGGAVLAPFHMFAGKVPAALQSELVQVGEGIASGTIQTPTKSPV